MVQVIGSDVEIQEVDNVVDRLRFGAVVDFLDFYVGSYHWHTFNVADSAISIGVAILLIEGFFGRSPTADEAQE